MVKVKGWTPNDYALYQTPYVPSMIDYIKKYGTTLEDASNIWYKIHVSDEKILNWIYNQPVGSWRYGDDRWLDNNPKFIELQDRIYSMFLLRWS